MSDTSAIDAKVNSSDGNTDQTKNDWGGFVGGVAKSCLHVVLFTLLVVNSIFYAHSDNLDLFFPTEWEQYFEKPGQKGGSKSRTAQRGGGAYKCKDRSIKVPSFSAPGRPKIDFLKEMGLSGNVYGWPYSMYDKQEEGNGTFKNWYAQVVAKTYMLLRTWWKKVYGWAPLRRVWDSAFVLLAPFQAVLGVAGGAVCGVCAPIYYGVTQEWWWGLVYTLCVLPILFTCLALTFIYKIYWFFMIMVAPVMINHAEVAEIAVCNQQLFTLVFGALVVNNAFQYLVPSVGYSALVLWIIMAVRAMMGK